MNEKCSSNSIMLILDMGQAYTASHNASCRIWLFSFVDSMYISYVAAATAALRFTFYYQLMLGLDNLCFSSLSLVPLAKEHNNMTII